MNVAELIERLSSMPQDANVVVDDYWDVNNISNVKISRDETEVIIETE